MPCWGNCDLISRRITASAARSASVTGSKSWALLLSIDSDVRKNGRIVSPDAVARRPTKAEKSMTVTLDSLEERADHAKRSFCLAQLEQSRTIIPRFPLVLWIPNRLAR